MIKRVLSILIVGVMFGMVGCSKKNVIPDDVLANIFHDAFVVNAYIGEERIDLDSLQIYEPLFNRYGYTAKDVVYTVGNFSRRKSARLGTVVEQAISRLETESKMYAKKVVILDTIRNVAMRTLTHTVYSDTLIKAKKRADSTALYIEISPIQYGEYIISYRYKCGDDLKRYPRSAEYYFYDENGNRNGFVSSTLRDKGSINRSMVSRTDNRKLVLNLGRYTNLNNSSVKNGKKGGKNKKNRPPKSQDLEIRDLKVVYKPNQDTAVDSLFERHVNIKIFADGFLIKTDSLTLSPDSTRVSTPTTADN